MVAARIRDVVIDPSRGDTEGIEIFDPAIGELRDCSYGDIAILFRSRGPVQELERALQECGAPYYLAGDAGLVERQEVADLIALLKRPRPVTLRIAHCSPPAKPSRLPE